MLVSKLAEVNIFGRRARLETTMNGVLVNTVAVDKVSMTIEFCCLLRPVVCTLNCLQKSPLPFEMQIPTVDFFYDQHLHEL